MYNLVAFSTFKTLYTTITSIYHHFTMYTSIKLLCETNETNMLYGNYASIKKIFFCHQPPIPCRYLSTILINTICWESYSSKSLLCSYKSCWIHQGCKVLTCFLPKPFLRVIFTSSSLER